MLLVHKKTYLKTLVLSACCRELDRLGRDAITFRFVRNLDGSLETQYWTWTLSSVLKIIVITLVLHSLH